MHNCETRRSSATLIVLLLSMLMAVACQTETEPQLAPTPILPATPLPPATPMPPPTPDPLATPRPAAGEPDSNTKVIDGYLHVWYKPCPRNPPSPAEWIAPIILTDLRYGSVVYLNGNGTIKHKPEYKTEEGRITLEAALKDRSIVEQIVARPQCP